MLHAIIWGWHWDLTDNMDTERAESFGYSEKIPENIRTEVMWLCQDVLFLQNEWDLFTELYGTKENTELLSQLAYLSFKIMWQTLFYDVTMGICRLGDPAQSGPKGMHSNLSLERLVHNCPDRSIELNALLAKFKTAYEPVNKFRNKRVGHRDLQTAIEPGKSPLPGVTKEQIDLALELAENILKTIFQHYARADLYFHSFAYGDAKDLIFWLSQGKAFHDKKFGNT